jgi:endogenous inhibitor of DNA gyrase (YacG/DUF329 family)
MADYDCPACGGGFPREALQENKRCPWCQVSLGTVPLLEWAATNEYVSDSDDAESDFETGDDDLPGADTDVGAGGGGVDPDASSTD